MSNKSPTTSFAEFHFPSEILETFALAGNLRRCSPSPVKLAVRCRCSRTLGGCCSRCCSANSLPMVRARAPVVVGTRNLLAPITGHNQPWTNALTLIAARRTSRENFQWDTAMRPPTNFVSTNLVSTNSLFPTAKRASTIRARRRRHSAPLESGGFESECDSPERILAHARRNNRSWKVSPKTVSADEERLANSPVLGTIGRNIHSSYWRTGQRWELTRARPQSRCTYAFQTHAGGHSLRIFSLNPVVRLLIALGIGANKCTQGPSDRQDYTWTGARSQGRTWFLFFVFYIARSRD